MNAGFKLCLVLASFFAGSSLVIRKAGEPVIFTKFPVERQLVETEYLKLNNLSPDGLSLYADSLLFIRNATNSSNYHFSLFNLSSRSFLSNHMGTGSRYGESLGFISYGVSNSYLWAYDIMKDKIILSNLDSALHGKAKAMRELAMPAFYYSIQLLDGTAAVASGDYDSDYKLAQLNLSTGSIEKQLVPYSSDTLVRYSRPGKMKYESFLFLKPGKQKCVLACRYADQIEIVDLASQQSKIIKGPENYEPEVMVMRGNDGKELSTRNADTRFAFVKGKVTDNFIYLLYSGNNNESIHKDHGKYIYVYDWNGNPVQKITLKEYVLDFVVTNNDSLLYTYDPRSKYIKVANLKGPVN